MQNKELFLALDELEKTMRLDRNEIIAAIESGLASAYKKETGESRAIMVTMNPDRQLIKYVAYQTVVDGEPATESELTLEEAREIKPDAQIGETIREDVTPKQLSRIAAQTAKQVISQKINEMKNKQATAEMNEKEGELMQAIVRRVDPGIGTVYVEIVGSQMEGVLAPSDQVFGEKLNVNDKIRVYVKKVRTTSRGATQVMVSRSSVGYVKKLFELEVPELRSGLVKIKDIVREAGYRTKLSVYTDEQDIDAVGSCIGAKGSRVNAIVNELNGEKVDVIPYSTNPSEYIACALSPARVLMVQLIEEERRARVVVSDERLSLAIGKNGQNARLAARLTGYKIDVKPYSSVASELEELDVDLGDLGGRR